MSRNAKDFIPMAGPERVVFELLEDLIWFECGHAHKKQCEGENLEVCGHDMGIEGMEEAAVRIAAMIERGEFL